jgi:mannose-6-phosphate isomerase-like protein (cupin superfamily)
MTPDQWFFNPITGMKMRMPVLPHETGGSGFVAEYSYGPHGGKEAFPPHLHPNTTETFEIISGTGRCLVGNEERPVKAGESIVLPPNVAHIHPWSDSDEPIVARQIAKCDPPDEAGMVAALQAAITIFGLANAGKAGPKGLPDTLQLAVLAHGTIPQTYLGSMPKGVQRVLTAGATVVAYAFGKRFAYPEYGVVTDKGIELPAGFKASTSPLPQA